MVNAGDFSFGPGEVQMARDWTLYMIYKSVTSLSKVISSLIYVILSGDFAAACILAYGLLSGYSGEKLYAVLGGLEMPYVAFRHLNYREPSIRKLFMYSFVRGFIEGLCQARVSWIVVSVQLTRVFSVIFFCEDDPGLMIMVLMTMPLEHMKMVTWASLITVVIAWTYLELTKPRMDFRNVEDIAPVMMAVLMAIGGFGHLGAGQGTTAACVVVLCIVGLCVMVVTTRLEITPISTKLRYNAKMAKNKEDCSRDTWDIGINSEGDLHWRSGRGDLLFRIEPKVKTDEVQKSVPDGVFTIKRVGKFYSSSQLGVGVTINGVLHTCYHVTDGLPLWYEGRQIALTRHYVQQDVAVYGGHNQMRDHKSGDVQLVAKPPDSPMEIVTISPGIMKLQEKGVRRDIYAIRADYPKGTSGSPIINNEDQVVGLYGSGLVTSDSDYVSPLHPTEADNYEDWEVNSNWKTRGMLTYVNKPPGFGKTTRDIKRMVEKAKVDRIRTILLAPTKVVVNEFKEVLGKDNIAYHVDDGSGKPNKEGLVIVMCHSTFSMRWIRGTANNFKAAPVYIMDEAHSQMPEALHARAVISSEVDEKRASAVFLSATFPWSKTEPENMESRHSITHVDLSHLMDSNDKNKLDLGKIESLEGRSIVFVTTVQKTNELASSVNARGKKKAVALNGKKSMAERQSIRDGDADIIFSTEVAELGGNYNVDNSVDLGEDIKPIWEYDDNTGYQVVLERREAALASRVQRRGRVGRTKEGFWYAELNLEEPEVDNDLKWTEEAILCHNTRGMGLLAGWKEEVGRAEPQAVDIRTLPFPAIEKMVRYCREMPILQAYLRAKEGDLKFATMGGSMEYDGSDELQVKINGKFFDCKPLIQDERMDWLSPYMKDQFGTRRKPSRRTAGRQNRSYKESWMDFGKSVLRGVTEAMNVVTEGTKGMSTVQAENAWTVAALMALIAALCAVVIVMLVNRFVDLLKVVMTQRYMVCSILTAVMAMVAWMTGYNLVHIMVAAGSFLFLLAIVMPEPSYHRSSTDSYLTTIVIMFMVFSGVVYANENGMLRQTKIDISNIYHELAGRVVKRNYPMAVIVPQPSGRPLHVVWAAMMVVLCIISSFQMKWKAKAISKALGLNKIKGFPCDIWLNQKQGMVGFISLVEFFYAGGALDFFTILVIIVTVTSFVVSVKRSDGFKICAEALHMSYYKDAKHVVDGSGTPIYRFDIFSGLANDPIPLMFYTSLMVGTTLDMYFTGWQATNLASMPMLFSLGLSVFSTGPPKNKWVSAFLSPIALFAFRAMLGGQAITPVVVVFMVMKAEERRGGAGTLEWLVRRMSTIQDKMKSSNGMVEGLVRQARQMVDTAAMNNLTGELWKTALNSLSIESFNKYRTHRVQERVKKESVSRGTHKLADIIDVTSFQPEGKVIDLGCGSGGWCQVSATLERVDEVVGYTKSNKWYKNVITTRKVEEPKRFSTRGFNLVNMHTGVDVYTKDPEECDTLLCDIGEQDANSKVEASRSLVVINMMDRWISEKGIKNFCFKVLAPYPMVVRRRLHRFQRRHGGFLYRSRCSRNSTHEMYYISGGHASIDNSVEAVSRTLLNRMSQKWNYREPLNDLPWEFGTRATRRQKIPKMEMVSTRIRKIEKEQGKLIQDKDAPYRTWKYFGSFFVGPTNAGGQAVNGIAHHVLGFFSRKPEVMDMKLTDCSVRGIQEVVKQKIDTKVEEPDEHLKQINEKLTRFIYGKLFSKNKPRKCTKEEFIEHVRSNAAIGQHMFPESWCDAAQAVQSKEFWAMVDKERDLHLKGDCEMCVYNTMPKREKKESSMGEAKTSRLIWYYWLGSRFLEFEALGFLNQDHIINRDKFPAGVGQVGLQYMGYVLNEVHERIPTAYCEDTAGWDTKISKHDLELESTIAEYCESDHAQLVKAIYKTYTNKIAFIKRTSSTGRTMVDVVGRNDQRGSGEVVTYALNTITNGRVQLGRLAESEDIIDNKQHQKLEGWLAEKGWERLSDMVIAGDDCVVFTNNEKYRTSLWYLNACGKTRKNMGLEDESVPIMEFSKIDFCSHHFHKMPWKKGWLVAPCRHQDQIFGRWRIQLGKIPSNAESACLAKAYSQMSLLYYFHRRDVRLAAFAVNSAVPNNWYPTGRTTWSVHQKHEWVSIEDMLSIWNRVWIEDNPYMDNDAKATSWKEVPRIGKREDVDCGSAIGTTERANWQKYLPLTVKNIRKILGEEYPYSDVLEKEVGHYKQHRVVTNLMGL
uniref:Polyprotein n=1 Tax=Sea-firefly flavivirus TaxID=3004162 RepID=A0A9C7GWT0_9FLAV|nr:polyprotein [Sea-firefly flavivirus]